MIRVKAVRMAAGLTAIRTNMGLGVKAVDVHRRLRRRLGLLQQLKRAQLERSAHGQKQQRGKEQNKDPQRGKQNGQFFSVHTTPPEKCYVN